MHYYYYYKIVNASAYANKTLNIIETITQQLESWDSVVGIAMTTGWISSPGRVKNILFSKSQTGSGAHPACYAIGIELAFPVSKASGT
jgi:hypothetical protein